MIDIDLIIAVAIITFVLLLILIVHIRTMPKRYRANIFVLIGAIASAFGIVIFRNYRIKLLRRELEEKERRLKEKEKKLLSLKTEYEASEEELLNLQAKLNQQREVYEKLILELKAKNKMEKERIDRLSGEDLHNEFLATFGN